VAYTKQKNSSKNTFECPHHEGLSLICASQIGFSYDIKPVFENISFTVEQGSSIAIVGPSGCGKSTLLSMLAGLLRPISGVIQSHGKIGILLQDYGLFPWKTVLDNLTLGLRIKKIPFEQKTIIALAEELGLEKLLLRYPSQLSGGERQRVALGRVLLLKPKILLFDEPFCAVDGITRQNLQQLIKSIWLQKNMTMILVTHDLVEACVLGQTIFVCSQNPMKIQSQILNPNMKTENYLESTSFHEVYRAVREALKKEMAHA
jgi:NitT/TauT family transport system ATP-binding protein